MTGYSGTPQARKLGIAEGCRLALVGAPRGWRLQDLPPTQRSGGASGADVLIAFATRPADLTALPTWGERVFPAGAVWVAWPRKAAGHVSEVTENAIRAAALEIGMVDTKVAAIDEDWSGLKIVWRKENRRRLSE
jgi:hypothetical protein